MSPVRSDPRVRSRSAGRLRATADKAGSPVLQFMLVLLASGWSAQQGEVPNRKTYDRAHSSRLLAIKISVMQLGRLRPLPTEAV